MNASSNSPRLCTEPFRRPGAAPTSQVVEMDWLDAAVTAGRDERPKTLVREARLSDAVS
jgi:hypothetical protein